MYYEKVTENPHYSSLENGEKPTHECGIGMVYSFAPTVKTQTMIDIGNALQHRGQNGVGISAAYGDFLKRSTADGLLHDAISDLNLSKFDNPNRWMMIHMRYGTQGGYSRNNLQPIEAWSQDARQIHVAVNGNLPYAQALRRDLPFPLPEDASDTYIAAHRLTRMNGRSWDEKIREFAELPEIQHGANNMFIGIGETMYIIRDQYGLHPLMMGMTPDGELAVVSETVALQKIGASILGEFPAGGIMRIDKHGPQMLRGGSGARQNRCVFEFDYFMSQNSLFPTYDQDDDGMHPERWMDVTSFRLKCGEIITQEGEVPDVDFVVGMADSGVPFAQGIANALGKPYMPFIPRSHYNGDGERTFMQDARMSEIPRLVRGKHMPIANPEVWKGKRVLKGDDSQVRGNTNLAINEMLRSLGVAEIHDWYGFPPVQYECDLGVSFRSRKELIAAQCNGDVEEIAKRTKATSVRFISPEGFIRATKRDQNTVVIPENEEDIFLENGYCGKCVTGKSPIPDRGTIFLYEDREERELIR